MNLAQLQVEVPYLANQWPMNDAVGSTYITDTLTQTLLLNQGSPVFGRPSMSRGDSSTSILGGYFSGTSNYFSGPITGYAFASGATVEGITAMEPNGQSFYLFNAPGQTNITVAGTNVSFTVYIGATAHTITASGVLAGLPQHVVGIYDPVAQLQKIYVDGAQVQSASLSGTAATTTTGNTVALQPLAASTTYAVGQDIAVYGAPLSAKQVLRHFQAFVQLWRDPGHVRAYEAPGAFT